MKINTDGKDAKGRAFGVRVGSASTWEGFGSNAEGERTRMVSEFHAWVVERRHEVEMKMLHAEGWMKEAAPFARVAMTQAETPAEIPMCVLEFASHCLIYVERRRQLDLLNVYYLMAANGYDESGLQVHQGLEGQVKELWDWFISERDEAAEKEAA